MIGGEGVQGGWVSAADGGGLEYEVGWYGGAGLLRSNRAAHRHRRGQGRIADRRRHLPFDGREDPARLQREGRGREDQGGVLQGVPALGMVLRWQEQRLTCPRERNHVRHGSQGRLILEV